MVFLLIGKIKVLTFFRVARKALLVENNELVTPREYEEIFKKCNDRKEVRCSCGAKLSFVETHTRTYSKGNSSIVSAFFRDSKTSVHKEDCPYNISNRIKEIVAESQCLPIEKGKFILSLKDLYSIIVIVLVISRYGLAISVIR